MKTLPTKRTLVSLTLTVALFAGTAASFAQSPSPTAPPWQRQVSLECNEIGEFVKEGMAVHPSTGAIYSVGWVISPTLGQMAARIVRREEDGSPVMIDDWAVPPYSAACYTGVAVSGNNLYVTGWVRDSVSSKWVIQRRNATDLSLLNTVILDGAAVGFLPVCNVWGGQIQVVGADIYVSGRTETTIVVTRRLGSTLAPSTAFLWGLTGPTQPAGIRNFGVGNPAFAFSPNPMPGSLFGSPLTWSQSFLRVVGTSVWVASTGFNTSDQDFVFGHIPTTGAIPSISSSAMPSLFPGGDDKAHALAATSTNAYIVGTSIDPAGNLFKYLVSCASTGFVGSTAVPNAVGNDVQIVSTTGGVISGGQDTLSGMGMVWRYTPTLAPVAPVNSASFGTAQTAMSEVIEFSLPFGGSIWAVGWEDNGSGNRTQLAGAMPVPASSAPGPFFPLVPPPPVGFPSIDEVGTSIVRSTFMSQPRINTHSTGMCSPGDLYLRQTVQP